MSGAECIAVAGVISSIIAIVDGIKQVVDAASEVEGLPKAFRQASNKLPLISDILEATKYNFEADDVSGVERSVTLVVDDCKDKWKTLNDLFDKVIPEEKASRVERYYKAVKTLGKGGKVESLMKGILDDIQLLATIKTMTTTNVVKVIKTVTAAQEEKVARAITDVAAWPPSVPDDVFQEGTYTNINYGTGQYISQGGAEQNNFQGEARQYHSGGGS
jgi:N-terminal domain on NACHT_NTPase and P-loop NTPases